MTDTAAGESHDPEAYTPTKGRCIQEAHQQQAEGVPVQRRVSRVRSWMELADLQHAEEAWEYIQESDGPPASMHKETAAGLILVLQSWTWNHTITLHENMVPPYARTATCRPDTAARCQVNLVWTPTQKNSEYTLVHTIRNVAAANEAKEPEQAIVQQTWPAFKQCTLYRELAHARTLAEHSIQLYTDVTYVQRMLQDWTKYETEVLEGHTGPRDIAPRAT